MYACAYACIAGRVKGVSTVTTHTWRQQSVVVPCNHRQGHHEGTASHGDEFTGTSQGNHLWRAVQWRTRGAEQIVVENWDDFSVRFIHQGKGKGKGYMVSVRHAVFVVATLNLSFSVDLSIGGVYVDSGVSRLARLSGDNCILHIHFCLLHNCCLFTMRFYSRIYCGSYWLYRIFRPSQCRGEFVLRNYLFGLLKLYWYLFPFSLHCFLQRVWQIFRCKSQVPMSDTSSCFKSRAVLRLQ
jgi:hypothetical protein